MSDVTGESVGKPPPPPEKSAAAGQTTKTEKSSLVENKSSDDPTCCCGHVSRPLLSIKLFYFFFCGGLGCILPFLSIYFKQLGLSPQQIGLISGLRPIVGFASGPLWGSLADKFSLRRVLLLISLLAWVSVFVGLAFIPPPARAESCPDELTPHRPVRPRILQQRDLEYSLVQYSTDNVSSSYNLSSREQEILREHLGWIYDPADLTRVFFTVLTLILLGEFVQSPTTALSDAGTLQALGPDRLDKYGQQRAWGPLGWALTSVTVGALVAVTRYPTDICGITVYFSRYFPYVYVFVVFMVLAFIFAALIPFKEDKKPFPEPSVELGAPASPAPQPPPAYSAWAVVRVFLNVHYGSWLVAAFFVGVFNGLIWGFLSWHLDNLGADQLLIGTAQVVNCLSEFITFFLVHHVIRTWGHMNIMYMGLLGYATRFAGYGLLRNPWWVLPFEALQGATFSCIWVSLTAYSTLAVPPHALATVQGILHGVYFGLGSGMGHLLGGVLIGNYGAAITFLSISSFSLLVAVFLYTCQKCSTKPEFAYQMFEEDVETSLDETALKKEPLD